MSPEGVARLANGLAIDAGQVIAECATRGLPTDEIAAFDQEIA